MLTTTKFWLWLTDSLPVTTAWTVLEHFGTPEKVYFAEKEAYAAIPDLSEKELGALLNKSMDHVDRILADCQRLSIRILTWQDSEYPERLRSIELPPMVLYLKGRPIHFDDEPLIAMAGTRKASEYGLRMARSFAHDITAGGGIVVTGVAKGCDQNAVMGAFDARGTVVAVLPGGIDVPFTNEESSRLLYRDLARYGTMVSEYPPGTANKGAHFFMRNRILTGLSLAVLCVEAGRRSGTLQVAGYAREQDRTTFVIPARIDDEAAAGTNELMCGGYALPVMSGRDILVHYTAMYPQLLRRTVPVSPSAAKAVESKKIKVSAQLKEPEVSVSSDSLPENSQKRVDSQKTVDYIDVDTFHDTLTTDEKQILDAIGSGTATAEELIAATGIQAGSLMATLTLLTIRGLVISEDGGRFRCAKASS